MSVYEYISIALADMSSLGYVVAAEGDRRVEPSGLEWNEHVTHHRSHEMLLDWNDLFGGGTDPIS